MCSGQPWAGDITTNSKVQNRRKRIGSIASLLAD